MRDHNYSSSTQPALASHSAKDHFQDCGPRMEMHPWRRISISERILRVSGESSKTSSTAVGINKTGCVLCRPAKSTDVPGQLSLAIPSWVGAMSTSQRAVTPCGWGVKAGVVRVWVAGKIV